MRLRLKTLTPPLTLAFFSFYFLLTFSYLSSTPSSLLSKTSIRPQNLVLIPVIKTNRRRQRRLEENLCGLSYPEKGGVEIVFSADQTSAALITLTRLIACGYSGANLSVILESQNENELQPQEADKRHSYSSQASRRIKIAKARNALLQNSLKNYHKTGMRYDKVSMQILFCACECVFNFFVSFIRRTTPYLHSQLRACSRIISTVSTVGYRSVSGHSLNARGVL